MPITEIPIANDADDGQVGFQVSNASTANWPPDTADTDVSTLTGNILNRTGNATTLNVYTVERGLLAFDTSAIPADATINAVSLKVWVTGRGIADAPVFCLEAYDWTSPPSADDYVYPMSTATFSTLVSNISTIAGTVGTVSGIPGSVITKAGITKLRMGININTVPPTLNSQLNYFSKGSYDADGGATVGAIPPTLVVDWTPPTETARPTATRNIVALTPNTDPTAYQAIDEDPDSADGTLLVAADPTGTSGLTNGPEYVDAPASATAWIGGTGAAWGTYANVIDTSEATNSTVTLAATNTDYQNFFSFAAGDWSDLPTDAIITGVSVVLRSSIGTANRVQHHIGLATANGTLLGAEKNVADNTAGSTTTLPVSTNTEKTVSGFSVMPTRAQLITGTFGVRFRQRRSNTSTITIYSIKATVTYSLPGSDTDTKVEVILADPAGTLSTGADTGEIRVAARRRGTPDSGAGNPTLRAEIHENGSATVLATPINDVTMDSGTVSVKSGTFNQNVITNKNNVEVWLFGTGVPGATVDFDAVEWNAQVAAGAQNIDKFVTDSLAISDSRVRVLEIARIQTDSLAMTDSRSALISKLKTITDSLALTDGASFSRGHGRTVSDALGITDDRTTTKGFGRTITDALGLTDAVARVSSKSRVVTDALGMTDSRTFLISKLKTITDALGMTDSTTMTRGHGRTVTDSLPMTDSSATARGMAKTLTDSLGLTDSRLLAKGKNVSDALGITDAASKVMTRARTITDALGLTDTTIRGFAKTRTVTDSLAMTDSASRQLTLVIGKLVTDTMGLTDSRTITRNLVRSQTDALGMTDSRVVTKALVRSLTDNMGLTDNANRVRTISRIVQDSLGVTDVATPVKVSFITKTVTDSLAMTDTANREVFRLIAKVVNDTLGMTDSRTRVRDLQVIRTDNIGITDSITKSRLLQRMLEDAVGITDSASTTMDKSLTVTDPLVMTDSINREFVRFIEITDELGLSDNTQYQIIAFSVAPFVTVELVAIPTATVEMLGIPGALAELLGIPEAQVNLEA